MAPDAHFVTGDQPRFSVNQYFYFKKNSCHIELNMNTPNKSWFFFFFFLFLRFILLGTHPPAYTVDLALIACRYFNIYNVGHHAHCDPLSKPPIILLSSVSYAFKSWTFAELFKDVGIIFVQIHWAKRKEQDLLRFPFKKISLCHWCEWNSPPTHDWRSSRNNLLVVMWR